jgi:hypothetical protein
MAHSSLYLQPKRGKVDPTTLKPDPLPDKPQTLWAQVERTHDQVSGLRLQRYVIPYEFDYTDIPACTATGGVSGGAGATVTLPVIPAKARVLNVWAEMVTSFVNDAGSQDIDGVVLNTDTVIADALLAANSTGIVAAPTFSLAAVNSGVSADEATQVLPKLYAVNVTPAVYFAGANTVLYTAGKMRLYVEVLSYFE